MIFGATGLLVIMHYDLDVQNQDG